MPCRQKQTEMIKHSLQQIQLWVDLPNPTQLTSVYLSFYHLVYYEQNVSKQQQQQQNKKEENRKKERKTSNIKVNI